MYATLGGVGGGDEEGEREGFGLFCGGGVLRGLRSASTRSSSLAGAGGGVLVRFWRLGAGEEEDAGGLEGAVSQGIVRGGILGGYDQGVICCRRRLLIQVLWRLCGRARPIGADLLLLLISRRQ